MDHRPKSKKKTTIKLFEENIEVCLHDLGVGKDFLSPRKQYYKKK